MKQLTTNRLSLRAITKADAKSLSVLRSNQLVNEFIERPKQTSLEDATTFVDKITEGIAKDGICYWGIQTNDSNTLIGTCCIFKFNETKSAAEIGYELLPTFWGKGIISEAAKVIINYAFHTLHLQELRAVIHQSNKASVGVISKFGFKKVEDKSSLDLKIDRDDFDIYLLKKE